ncbi:Uncharacterised protein [Klebsiella pneumoniae]|nr:Uncharacterised protein [Klebsiella pneumoniae]
MPRNLFETSSKSVYEYVPKDLKSKAVSLRNSKNRMKLSFM